MPNTLVVSTFGCPFSEFEMMVKKVDKEQGYVFCSELEIVKVNEHKAMILMNCSDLEKFGAMLEQPELKHRVGSYHSLLMFKTPKFSSIYTHIIFMNLFTSMIFN